MHEDDEWKPGGVDLACHDEVKPEFGYVRGGLAIVPIGHDWWSVTHRNTGFRVISFRAKTGMAFKVASAIYNLIDWDFTGLDGWKNSAPDLPERLLDVISGFPVQYRISGRSGRYEENDRRQAAEVLERRGR